MLLGNGQVLIVGGYDQSDGPTATAELFDPASGAFWPTGPMSVGRAGPAAALLPDGRVLVIGDYTTAEIYWP